MVRWRKCFEKKGVGRKNEFPQLNVESALGFAGASTPDTHSYVNQPGELIFEPMQARIFSLCGGFIKSFI